MNRRMWMVGLLGLILLLVGCGAPGPTTTEDSSTQTPELVRGDYARPPVVSDDVTTEDSSTETPEGATVDYVRRTIAPDAEPTEGAPTETPEGMTPSDVQRMSVLDAKSLLDNDQAVLYDARSESSYLERHAAGALSFPEAGAADRVGELPTDKALIFYCT